MLLVNEVYGDFPNIQKKLWEAYKSGAVPTDFMPYYDQAVIDYIARATE